jgi:molybdenum cofactor biosynthesis enzyme
MVMIKQISKDIRIEIRLSKKRGNKKEKIYLEQKGKKWMKKLRN